MRASGLVAGCILGLRLSGAALATCSNQCTLEKNEGVQKYSSQVIFSSCKCQLEQAGATEMEKAAAAAILQEMVKQDMDSAPKTKMGGASTTETTVNGRRIKMTTSETTVSAASGLTAEVVKYLHSKNLPVMPPSEPAPGGSTSGLTQEQEAQVKSAVETAKKLTDIGISNIGLTVLAVAGGDLGTEKNAPSAEPGLQGGSEVSVPVSGSGDRPGGAAPSPQQVDRMASQLTPDLRDEVGQQVAQGEQALERAGVNDERRFVSAGEVLNAVGRPRDALRSFNRAVALDAGDEQALSQRARAKAMLGEMEGARADARKALVLDPHDKLAQIIVGHEDSLAGAQAKMAGKKAAMGAGLDPQSLLEAGGPSASSGGTARGGAQSGSGGQSGGVLGTMALAGAGFAAASFQTMTPSMLAMQKAFQKMRVHDYTGALVDASAAIDADRKSAAAWILRAEIDSQLESYKGAVADAGEALKLAPADAQALRAKAYAEIQLGNYAQALEDIGKAIALDPGNGVGFMYRAIAEEKLGRIAEALKDYDKADDLDPSLMPLTKDAFARNGAGYDTNTSKPAPIQKPLLESKQLVRGGTAVVAAGLILLGLIGVLAGRKLTCRPPAADPEATVLDAAAAPVIGEGTVLGNNFRVTGELGRGGMGVVYDAFDETLQRRVAIKQLKRDESTTSDDLERLLKEARLVAQLKHPHLAEIYTVVNEGDLFLVFEFIDGQPLDKVLSVYGKLPLERAQKLVADVASALDYAHARQIIHRDLKPSNIMISKDGSAKVMDFGIAHQASGSAALTRTQASGTPPYMAPEQAMGSVSKASDLYALAVMTFEMVSGRRPFSGPDFLEQKLRKAFTAASSTNPSIPKALDEFFASALDPDPTKRPASGDAFVREFAKAASAVGSSSSSANGVGCD